MHWKSGRWKSRNKKCCWKAVEPNDDTNSTIPEQSTMLGLINFNGDHSTMETQVLTDSDKAPLGLMSVMDDDVGIELDSPGSVGAAPPDKRFVALDQFLLPNATKPTVQSVETFQNDTTNYTLSNFFGSNMSHGALYVAFRNFLEAGNDNEVLDDELGLDSSLCLLRQSSLKQSMLVSIRKEYQFKFCFPSLIIAAHSIRKQLGAGPDARIRNELT